MKADKILRDGKRRSDVVNRQSVKIKSIVVEDWFGHRCPHFEYEYRLRPEYEYEYEYEYELFNARTLPIGWFAYLSWCCYWKQWRRPKTRRRKLIQLGVPPRQAIRHAKSRQGPWRMSQIIASGVGMTNAWLQDQGLLSLKTLWAELAPLR